MYFFLKILVSKPNFYLVLQFIFIILVDFHDIHIIDVSNYTKDVNIFLRIPNTKKKIFLTHFQCSYQTLKSALFFEKKIENNLFS